MLLDTLAPSFDIPCRNPPTPRRLRNDILVGPYRVCVSHSSYYAIVRFCQISRFIHLVGPKKPKSHRL